MDMHKARFRSTSRCGCRTQFTEDTFQPCSCRARCVVPGCSGVLHCSECCGIQSRLEEVLRCLQAMHHDSWDSECEQVEETEQQWNERTRSPSPATERSRSPESQSGAIISTWNQTVPLVPTPEEFGHRKNDLEAQESRETWTRDAAAESKMVAPLTDETTTSQPVTKAIGSNSLKQRTYQSRKFWNRRRRPMGNASEMKNKVPESARRWNQNQILEKDEATPSTSTSEVSVDHAPGYQKSNLGGRDETSVVNSESPSADSWDLGSLRGKEKAEDSVDLEETSSFRRTESFSSNGPGRGYEQLCASPENVPRYTKRQMNTTFTNSHKLEQCQYHEVGEADSDCNFCKSRITTFTDTTTVKRHHDSTFLMQLMSRRGAELNLKYDLCFADESPIPCPVCGVLRRAVTMCDHLFETHVIDVDRVEDILDLPRFYLSWRNLCTRSVSFQFTSKTNLATNSSQTERTWNFTMNNSLHEKDETIRFKINVDYLTKKLCQFMKDAINDRRRYNCPFPRCCVRLNRIYIFRHMRQIHKFFCGSFMGIFDIGRFLSRIRLELRSRFRCLQCWRKLSNSQQLLWHMDANQHYNLHFALRCFDRYYIVRYMRWYNAIQPNLLPGSETTWQELKNLVYRLFWDARRGVCAICRQACRSRRRLAVHIQICHPAVSSREPVDPTRI